MALGRRNRGGIQGELFVTSADLPRSPGCPFYEKLNQILDKHHFDDYVETLCAPFYADVIGRPGIAPGIYFRMLFIGYFEQYDSQRKIAWNCDDRLSLRAFLGLSLKDSAPDHSSLSNTRGRLNEAVHNQVFEWILQLCVSEGLLDDPKTVAVDSTTLEANASLKRLVRKDSGDDYKTYLRKLMEAEGIKNPTDEEVIRFDKNRKGKTLSNEDWESETDPDSRIAKMKDKTTHLAYKAEHVVDLKSDVILAAEIYAGNDGDSQTYVESVLAAQTHLDQLKLPAAAEVGEPAMSASEAICTNDSGLRVKEAVLDKGYSDAQQMDTAAEFGFRTYVAVPDQKHDSVWVDKPPEYKKAVYANRRRAKGKRGRSLQKQRSEQVERSFAHVCETGGSRRSWLRGFSNVRMRYSMAAAAKNLGTLMRYLCGVGTPRSLQNGLSDGDKAKFEGANALAWLFYVLLAIQKCFRARVLHQNRFDFIDYKTSWIV
jgi:transposase